MKRAGSSTFVIVGFFLIWEFCVRNLRGSELPLFRPRPKFWLSLHMTRFGTCDTRRTRWELACSASFSR